VPRLAAIVMRSDKLNRQDAKDAKLGQT
jgi:hypothetical protein